jgi:hypothetical protein
MASLSDGYSRLGAQKEIGRTFSPLSADNAQKPRPMAWAGIIRAFGAGLLAEVDSAFSGFGVDLD